MSVREEIIEILNVIKKNVDYDKETALVDNGILESLEIVSLVNELSDTFDVEITVNDLVPENFNSVDGMVEMIERLED
ncbi:MAG: phosphopantetheine-binding protein [Clostridia bacterium]|nr:phosphopantetheine-binding protein [Clostridia bacterium]